MFSGASYAFGVVEGVSSFKFGEECFGFGGVLDGEGNPMVCCSVAGYALDCGDEELDSWEGWGL